jgi:hypothetical protein
MSLDEQYRDKIRNAVWLAIVQASMTAGPDGTKVAVLKSGEVLDALTWLQATVMTTVPQASTPDGLRACTSKMAKRLRQLTRGLRRDGAALLFDVWPAAPN